MLFNEHSLLFQDSTSQQRRIQQVVQLFLETEIQELRWQIIRGNLMEILRSHSKGLLKWLESSRRSTPRAGEGVEGLVGLYQSVTFLKSKRIHNTSQPLLSQIVLKSRERSRSYKAWTRPFPDTLSIATKNWEQPNCPPTGDWIHKLQ